VHFLMQVDMSTVINRRMEGHSGALSEAELQVIRSETMEQTLATLRNRINELGVSEAVVQRQGLNRVIVELPGIQDTAYARDILGKTATLKFVLEDQKHSVKDVVAGSPVVGSKIYFDRFNRPALLKTQAIVTGESVVSASTSQDRDGHPSVAIRLGGDVALFSKVTRENIGHRMAVIYIENNHGVNTESVISLATIQSALGNQFQITGLRYEEARDLALLLRAGALPAPVSIVEESIVGPSLGQENIRMGMISVAVGLGLVLLGMATYYSVFGIIANVALVVNLILLVAAMSLIGATLTLPGIAGIVLTLGMAVDANVLIFERIREELRLGLSARASIHRGFQYAFATIVDSNLTTLIVGVVLFAIGTGPVKGFAVTLSIGILTSLLTATMGTRSLVELLYGSKTAIKRLRVGI
jgi:preprotein translocase subunit SecD